MSSSFLEIARQGRNGWQQYLLGILLLLIMPVVGIAVIAVVTVILMAFLSIIDLSSGSSLTRKDAIEKLFSATFYGFPFFKFFILGIFVMLFTLTLVFVTEQIHERKFSTLLGFEDGSLDWGRIVQGFGVSFGISTSILLILYLINPSRYQFSFNAAEWLVSLPFSFLLSVFMSIWYCLFFLAYLLQGLGISVRKPVRLTIVYGLILGTLFTALGHNPTTIDWFRSIFVTMFYVWLVLKDDGLELVLGRWLAGGLFTFAVSGIPDKQFQTPKILTITSELSSPISLLLVLITSALFYYICFYIKPRKVVG